MRTVASFVFGTGTQNYARILDNDGRIAAYTLKGQNILLGYDAASQIIVLGQTNGVTTYDYNTLGHLNSYLQGAQSQSFSYDTVGNRKNKVVGKSVTNYQYANTSNRLASIQQGTKQAKTLQFDANGSITNDTLRTFTYDIRGRLSKVVQGKVTLTYAVNAQGQRVRKQTTGVDTVYHYDAGGTLIAESDAVTGLLREYIWLGDQPVAVVSNIINKIKGNPTLYYIHTDHLNTPRIVTNDQAKTVWQWDNIDPFGNNLPNENPSALGLFELPLRFNGQVADRETGVFYNYFRDCYDPATGRYCQSDPIGLMGGLNTYGYVGNDPLGFVDPLGLGPAYIIIPLIELGLAINDAAIGEPPMLGGIVSKSPTVPGINKPFRTANAVYPPNASLVSSMNNIPNLRSNLDCSEIANKLYKQSGGNGKILTVLPAKGKDLTLIEFNKMEGGMKYHEVYSDGRYIYDPRLSSNAIPEGDWARMINALNPGAVIKDITKKYSE